MKKEWLDMWRLMHPTPEEEKIGREWRTKYKIYNSPTAIWYRFHMNAWNI